MRPLTCLLLFWTLTTTTPGWTATWLTDLGSAKQRMAAENKPLLMLFTGSDWCPACQRLKRDVFAKPEFAAYADSHLVLLELDFPRQRALPAAQKQANENLSQMYAIRYFPSMILIDPRGQEIARVRYGGDGVQNFLSVLATQLNPSPNGRQPVARGPSPPEAAAPLFNGAAPAPPTRYTELVLKNISGPRDRRFALINNQTFAPGEVARVKLESGEVKVRCVEIRDRSVLVSVDGKPGQRELRLASTP